MNYQEDKIIKVSAILNGIRKSPRKMRLIVNLIKNKKLLSALDILKYSKKKQVSIFLRKLLISSLFNWRKKCSMNNLNLQEDFLYIKNIQVNQGKTLKRLRPVPQGRGHKIRKRSSKIIVFLENRNINYGSKN
ncbi:large ribosomal subunit protein uL22 [Blattabacterium cuenoti]|uniref:large ribosomal subunit protein uL22 n=1 Tax=Blattabacterium cuenoti TaxID=1653831 RepID=UPI00163CEA57|nr:uL22 family ribosomal protein [Blattabacterium cuenoti]